MQVVVDMVVRKRVVLAFDWKMWKGGKSR